MAGWTDPRTALGLVGDAFSLRADGKVFNAETMTPAGDGRWADGGVEVRLVASTASDGSHSLVLEADGVERVEEVCLLDHTVSPAPDSVDNYNWYDFGGFQDSTVVFVRRGTGGFFASYANPFAKAQVSGDHVRLSYRPQMDFGGTFRSDALVTGPFTRDGRELRREMLAGRDLVQGREPGYGSRLGPGPVVLDRGEAKAVRDAVAARVPWKPARARVSHWDWGENLFRLATADGASEAAPRYERMQELCSEIGVEVVLLAPAIESLDPSIDGPWQFIMFLGMGLTVGRGVWSAGREPAASLRLLERGQQLGLGAAAYSNPQILWLRNEDWAVQLPEASPYRWTCLAVPAARDHVITTMRAFADTYDLRGFSLDFVFWQECVAEHHGHAPGESRYAQWDGYRRVLAALASAPDAWVEALIGSPELLPWGALDMTHPHPVIGDNQPQWIPAWPDLSLDRANANYQRRAAYWMRNFAFTPTYKIPGQVGHQANRIVVSPVERGWDWEGARFNLLSAIASAPSTLSVCYLPAWDETEWKGMRDRDGAFFAHWIDFAKEHAEVLARMEDLFDEPRPGAVDATMATSDDGSGFVFLANPDYDDHRVTVPLAPGRFLRELHPEQGRLWDGAVTVEPHEVMVLEIVDKSALGGPVLLGASGALDGAGHVVTAAGRPGSTVSAAVRGVDGIRRPVALRFVDDGITPALEPWRLPDGTETDLGVFEGDATLTTEWVPGGALPGLLAQLAPPLAPTGDELLQPWSDPSRLRLFVELLDPQAVTVGLSVDGQDVDVAQAWMGTFSHVKDPDRGWENNLLGHYVDLTDRLLATTDLGRPWRIALTVSWLWPGQLRGVHVAHLPRRRTDAFHEVESRDAG